jgi:hypothetical protein
MEGCRDRQFFLEPQQTFHRRYEALRSVFVEGQPLEPVAARFGYKVSTLRSMVSRFRADRRCGVTPPCYEAGVKWRGSNPDDREDQPAIRARGTG